MLDCQNFCRRHEGSLIAVFHDLGQGQGRHDGLAGADVALDEALHGYFAFHIALDIEESTGLATGQGKGQPVEKLFQKRSVGAALDALFPAFPSPPEAQASLHVEQFFIGQLLPGLFLFFPAFWEMHPFVGLDERKAGMARLRARCRQKIRFRPGQGQGLTHGFSHVGLAQPVGQAVEGHQSPVLQLSFLHIGRIHLAPAIIPLYAAKGRYGHARMELSFLEGLIEPGHFYGSRFIVEHDF